MCHRLLWAGRHTPMEASARRPVAGALIALPTFTHNLATVDDNGAFIPIWASVFLYSYTLGSRSSLVPSIVGLAGLIAGINLSAGPFNPVPEMLTLGPWLGGLMVASRRRAATELEQRAKELEEEREVFARESVRYERARIARELHDIVAHCVSLMVVQANAGERLASVDPGGRRRGLRLHQRGRPSSRGRDRPSGRDARRLLAGLHRRPGCASSKSSSVGPRHPACMSSCHMSGDIDDLTAEGADGCLPVGARGDHQRHEACPRCTLGDHRARPHG